jgi:murein DD-endopeptidase MepM/ murein hydrolase activator NlpD
MYPRPFEHWWTYPNHVGIDYPYPNDTIVRASGTGVVSYSGWFSPAAGYGVSVNYGNGIVMSYKHSDYEDWRAPVGMRVSEGTAIMEIGTSGLSTGYHLHHEVYVNTVIQTGENYWRYMDKSPNGYVGAGSTSGGGTTPFPDDEDWDEMATQEEIRKIVREEIAAGAGKSVWGYKMAGGAPVAGKSVPTETAGERLRQVRRSTFNTGTIIRATYANVRKILSVVTGLATPPEPEAVAEPTSVDNA